jgi:ABC-type transport system involved in multi-copper enzyme maturation permease subunit
MKSDIRNVLSAELFKLLKRKSSIVLPALVIILTALLYLGLDLATRREWVGVPSGFYLASASIGWMVNIITILIIVVSSFHVSSEFSLGTVKEAWIRPVSRGSWFAGKILIAFTMTAVLFILAVAVTVILSGLRFGYSDLMEKNYLVHSAGDLRLHLVLAVVLILWNLLAVTAVAAAFASWLNHPGGAIAACLGAGLLLTVAAVFQPLKPFLLNTYLSLPSEQMIAMSKGLPLPLERGALVWRSLAGGGVWMACALGAGYYIIRRKEITF